MKGLNPQTPPSGYATGQLNSVIAPSLLERLSILLYTV